ncbi:MAG: glycosyltransferase family 2 protein [Rhizobacter sp.]|jgi:glycosyltransferase involved in cell wall biosynthesis|nr:glycosyltransferase family 2 protein [Rhizobacter sp.]
MTGRTDELYRRVAPRVLKNMQMQTSIAAMPSWDGAWIAIPAYNEARTIRRLAQAALALCPRVIVVDDGSSDGTLGELQDLPVTLLRHPSNRGKAAALRSAFALALGEGAVCVVSLDGDGQHEPSDAPGLLGAWRRQPDRLVIGSRLHDKERFPVARYRANRFACFWISWASGHPIADSQSGYRVYPAAVMRLALAGAVHGSRFTFESEILIEAADHGHLTLAVAIPGCYPANARRSHFRPVIDITKIVAMVGSRLLKKGMHPIGLWRSLRPIEVLLPQQDAMLDG